MTLLPTPVPTLAPNAPPRQAPSAKQHHRLLAIRTFAEQHATGPSADRTAHVAAHQCDAHNHRAGHQQAGAHACDQQCHMHLVRNLGRDQFCHRGVRRAAHEDIGRAGLYLCAAQYHVAHAGKGFAVDEHRGRAFRHKLGRGAVAGAGGDIDLGTRHRLAVRKHVRRAGLDHPGHVGAEYLARYVHRTDHFPDTSATGRCRHHPSDGDQSQAAGGDDGGTDQRARHHARHRAHRQTDHQAGHGMAMGNGIVDTSGRRAQSGLLRRLGHSGHWRVQAHAAEHGLERQIPLVLEGAMTGAGQQQCLGTVSACGLDENSNLALMHFGVAVAPCKVQFHRGRAVDDERAC